MKFVKIRPFVRLLFIVSLYVLIWFKWILKYSYLFLNCNCKKNHPIRADPLGISHRSSQLFNLQLQLTWIYQPSIYTAGPHRERNILQSNIHLGTQCPHSPSNHFSSLLIVISSYRAAPLQFRSAEPLRPISQNSRPYRPLRRGLDFEDASVPLWLDCVYRGEWLTWRGFRTLHIMKRFRCLCVGPRSGRRPKFAGGT